MKTDKTEPKQFGETFAHLMTNGDVIAVPVDDLFWTEAVSNLPPGRLVSVLKNTTDWTSWEMHPEGEEFIMVLSGSLMLHFEHAGESWSEDVREGQFVIVPRCVWHTADVPEPGRTMFVTAGENTENRKR